MKVTVQLFARARDLAGHETVELELPANARIEDLRRELGTRSPALLPLLPHLLIAVDHKYAGAETTLSEESLIACFPPVSGG